MKKFFNRLREKGQSIVEFAIIVGPALMLFLTIVYFGMLASDYMALKHVAGTAARATTLTAGVASISEDDKTVLKKHTTLLISQNMDLTPEVVKYNSGNNDGFINVTATAKIDRDALPLLIKTFFSDELSAVSAPEYKTESN